MRPIGSVNFNDFKYRVDIEFGGQSPVTKEESDSVAKCISRDGLFVTDIQHFNFCYTQTKTPDFPNGVPIHFDPGNLTAHNKLSQTVRHIAPILGRDSAVNTVTPIENEIPDEQDIEFQDLREKFSAMFTNTSPGQLATEAKTVSEFWKTMIKATEEKRLLASWIAHASEKPIYQTITNISRAYQEQLEAHSAVFTLTNA